MELGLVMTRNEFDASARQLFELCEAFNASDSGGCMNVQIIPIQESIMNTATTFLRLNDAIDVIYCPNYQVPVGYIAGMVAQPEDPIQSYDLPTVAKWGFTEHPITGIYCLFWHPCQTSAVLKELTSHNTINRKGALEIMLHWLGIYNHHLSLQLPAQFFSYVNTRLSNNQTNNDMLRYISETHL